MKFISMVVFSTVCLVATGCSSQVASPVKPEASKVAGTQKQTVRSGLNWKWIAGIVAVGLIIHEVQDDDGSDVVAIDNGGGQ